MVLPVKKLPCIAASRLRKAMKLKRLRIQVKVSVHYGFRLGQGIGTDRLRAFERNVKAGRLAPQLRDFGGDNGQGMALRAEASHALARFGLLGLAAEFGLVPAAVLATPGAHDLSNAKRNPTHQPQTAGENRQQQMQAVVDFCSNEKLLVPAPGTVSAYLILSHLGKKHAVAYFSRLLAAAMNHFTNHFNRPSKRCRKLNWLVAFYTIEPYGTLMTSTANRFDMRSFRIRNLSFNPSFTKCASAWRTP